MNLGEKVIISAIGWSIEKKKVKEVYDIINPFIDSPLDIDVNSICDIEWIIKEEILKVTDQSLKEQRKSKLDRLNEIISGEELIYDPELVKEFYRKYFNNEIII